MAALLRIDLIHTTGREGTHSMRKYLVASGIKAIVALLVVLIQTPQSQAQTLMCSAIAAQDFTLVPDAPTALWCLTRPRPVARPVQ